MTTPHPADHPEADAPTRERILAAAAQALSTKGYAKAHLAEIARIARVQPPAVYYYFSSREELVAAVMAEGQRLVREHVEATVGLRGPVSDVADRVAAAVEAHLRVELELSDFARAVTRNAGQLPAHLRAGLDAGSEAFHGLWRGLLREAADQGRLRDGLDPSVARMLVVGALNWATEWWTPAVPIDRVVEQAQHLVRDALFA